MGAAPEQVPMTKQRLPLINHCLQKNLLIISCTKRLVYPSEFVIGKNLRLLFNAYQAKVSIKVARHTAFGRTALIDFNLPCIPPNIKNVLAFLKSVNILSDIKNFNAITVHKIGTKVPKFVCILHDGKMFFNIVKCIACQNCVFNSKNVW